MEAWDIVFGVGVFSLFRSKFTNPTKRVLNPTFWDLFERTAGAAGLHAARSRHTTTRAPPEQNHSDTMRRKHRWAA